MNTTNTLNDVKMFVYHPYTLRRLQSLASGITNNYNIQVKYSDNDTATDGKTIWISPLVRLELYQNVKKEKFDMSKYKITDDIELIWLLLKSALYHESFHILWTDFTIANEYFSNLIKKKKHPLYIELLKKISNILEDKFVNNLGIKLFNDAKKCIILYHKLTWLLYRQNKKNPEDPLTDLIKNLIDYVILGIKKEKNDFAFSKSYNVFKIIQPIVDKTIQEIDFKQRLLYSQQITDIIWKQFNLENTLQQLEDLLNQLQNLLSQWQDNHEHSKGHAQNNIPQNILLSLLQNINNITQQEGNNISHTDNTDQDNTINSDKQQEQDGRRTTNEKTMDKEGDDNTKENEDKGKNEKEKSNKKEGQGVNESRGEKDTEDEKGETDEEGNTGEDEGNESDRKMIEQIKKEIEEIKQMQQMLNNISQDTKTNVSNHVIYPAFTSEQYQKYMSIVNNNQLTINLFKKELQKKLKKEELINKSYCGLNMNTKQLYDKKRKIFLKKEERDIKDLNVVIIVDGSGSMAEVSKKVINTVVILFETLSSFRNITPYVIYHFATFYNNQISVFSTKNKFATVSYDPNYYTREDITLTFIKNFVKNFSDKNTLLFIVSDGEPYCPSISTEQMYKNVRDIVKSLKIPIIAIALYKEIYEPLSQLYSNTNTILCENLNILPYKILNAVQKFL